MADITAAAGAHTTAVAAADGVEIRLETAQQANETSVTINRHERIDQERDVAWTESRTGDSEQQTYRTAAGTVYVRVESPAGVRYRAEEDPLDDSSMDIDEFQYGAIDVAEPDWLEEAIEVTGEEF